MRVRWAVVLMLWARAGWAEDVIVTQEGNSTHITTPGNLAPTRDPGCIRLDEAGADLAPPDLFLGIIQCLKRARAADAAHLYLLMVTRSRFDAMRVTDKSAHQAGTVLVLQLRNAVLPQDLTALQDAVTALGKPGSAQWAGLCARVRATGVPGHDPGYMIGHGMGAFVDGQKEPLVADFDAGAAWQAMLSTYLKCPNS